MPSKKCLAVALKSAWWMAILMDLHSRLTWVVTTTC